MLMFLLFSFLLRFFGLEFSGNFPRYAGIFSADRLGITPTYNWRVVILVVAAQASSWVILRLSEAGLQNQLQQWKAVGYTA